MVYNKCDILTTLRGNDCLWFLMAIFNYICLVSGGPKVNAAKGFSYCQMIKIGLNNLATATTYSLLYISFLASFLLSKINLQCLSYLKSTSTVSCVG